MAEPKSMISPPRQPMGWPTHKYQHCLKTVMPAKSIGTNMTMHRNIPRELMPNARYNKLPERWRWKAQTVLPPVTNQHADTNGHGRKEYNTRPAAHGQSRMRSTHLDVRPPSAYSESIVLKPVGADMWTVNQRLDSNRLRGLMRDNTFYPGNFSTLYKCSKELAHCTALYSAQPNKADKMVKEAIWILGLVCLAIVSCGSDSLEADMEPAEIEMLKREVYEEMESDDVMERRSGDVSHWCCNKRDPGQTGAKIRVIKARVVTKSVPAGGNIRCGFLGLGRCGSGRQTTMTVSEYYTDYEYPTIPAPEFTNGCPESNLVCCNGYVFYANIGNCLTFTQLESVLRLVSSRSAALNLLNQFIGR